MDCTDECDWHYSKSRTLWSGGTYAHSDIAMSFAAWISPEFQLYIMKDYRRLKADENSRLSLNWNLNREISKLNYRIHTDAIKENLLPPELIPLQISYKYADEADMLNVVLFGKTAKQWRDENPNTGDFAFEGLEYQYEAVGMIIEAIYMVIRSKISHGWNLPIICARKS